MKIRPFSWNASLFVISFLLLVGCRKEQDAVEYGGFPDEIGEILVTNCASAGCHDDGSFASEGRLSLAGLPLAVLPIAIRRCGND
jgi:hypothetical protein